MENSRKSYMQKVQNENNNLGGRNKKLTLSNKPPLIDLPQMGSSIGYKSTVLAFFENATKFVLDIPIKSKNKTLDVGRNKRRSILNPLFVGRNTIERNEHSVGV